MVSVKYPSIFFFACLVLFVAMLSRVDRLFFKGNESFCVRFIYSCLPVQPGSEQHSVLEDGELRAICRQRFHYLAKGLHTFAFVSEDGQYVIKFHRFPSHMRLFPWLNRPLAYHFKQERVKKKQYNLDKYAYMMQSYEQCFRDLKEEAGLILIHTQRSSDLQQTITIVDKLGAEYKVRLDDVTFILQHRAELIYPTLDRLVQAQRIAEAKQVVSHVVQLIASCCAKGYVDNDPVLRKNYGLLLVPNHKSFCQDLRPGFSAGQSAERAGIFEQAVKREREAQRNKDGSKIAENFDGWVLDRAIHIDVGDMVQQAGVAEKAALIAHVKEMTESLRKRLVSEYPMLVEHYTSEISSLERTL